MRLKHIKLAGFKSFVDPTKVPFEQQMTAIVGPNGCGKSNIIDAVRWVLGESSAKNLRGDAITDVIFNGSASRKPIGQASVELVFDNSQGRIKGNMADRSQVSIRRIVNRDSQNSYYLNGSKCRRRDITDIFLGTGLGPRSYAIIEQGTISRLIESKPQELRVFIEEAAGISKYKERRRETENRIVHTRENLARLADIRAELTLRIDALHKQAEAAKRFRTLKADERKYKAELTVLRLQQYQKKQQQFLGKSAQLQSNIELLIIEQGVHENALFNTKQQLHVGGENIDDLQAEKLSLTNKIARAEQDIKHINLQQSSVKQAFEQAQKQLLEDQQQLIACQQTLQNKNDELIKLKPHLVTGQKRVSQAQEALTQANDDLYQWQQTREQYHLENQRYAKNHSQLTASISAKKNIYQEKNQRILALKEALTKLTAQNPLSADNDELIQQNQTLTLAFKVSAASLKETQIQIASWQQKLAEKNQQLAQQQGIFQATELSLSQLLEQQNQRSDWQNKQHSWLKSQGLNEDGFLYQHLNVNQGWQGAVEMVLATWLQAQQIRALPEQLNLEPLLLVTENGHDGQDQSAAKAGTLAEKVSGKHHFNAWLNHIFVAKNYQEAQELLTTLTAEQSVICPDTTWLGHGFLKKGQVNHQNEQLSRQAYIEQLQQTLLTTKQKINQNQQDVIALELQLVEEQQQQKSFMAKRDEQQQLLTSNQKKLALQQQQQQYFTEQQVKITEQLTELQQILPLLESEISDLERQLVEVEKVAPPPYEQQQSKDEQQQLQVAVSQAQQRVNQLSQQQQQIAVQIERAQNQQTNSELNQRQLQEKISASQVKQQQLELTIKENTQPLSENEQQLQTWLAHMLTVEGKLTLVHENLVDAQQAAQKIEQSKTAANKKVMQLKEQASKHHLEAESYRIRAQGMLEQLEDMQLDQQMIEKHMPVEAKEAIWQAYLVKVAKDINRLGAINLAAITEYDEQLERKTYLDQQNEDLVTATVTLEAAIAKIDRESKQKFKATFEQVNHDLKKLFPKVFGGGSAYLDLTGDDLLETGVTIMARPPGKKNSTIHLLSGGEKALTALSLVFAIFRLNPAPFCMLDEVDAPLDDANVERFCNLVREMSQTVQFIYISHNKIAMEMATQLTGITMFEAGVSRMVAVDIDEAMAMADQT